MVKNLFAVQEMQETWVQTLGWEDPLEKKMATHSSILVQGISLGQRSLTGYRPCGSLCYRCKELDMTEATEHIGLRGGEEAVLSPG